MGHHEMKRRDLTGQESGQSHDHDVKAGEGEGGIHCSREGGAAVRETVESSRLLNRSNEFVYVLHVRDRQNARFTLLLPLPACLSKNEQEFSMRC